MSNVAGFEITLVRSLTDVCLRHQAIVAGGVVIAISLVPGVDFTIARIFYLGDRQFLGEGVKLIQFLRFVFLSAYVGACIIVVIGLLASHFSPRGWLYLGVSQWLFLALCLGVGPGVVANLALKDHSGRARPGQIVELGGQKQFSPAFASSNQCVRNCSFVSGEASSTFVMWFAAACVWRRNWRVLVCAGCAAGGIAGLIRMSQGAHFLSDVVFAAVFMAMTVTFIQFVFDTIAASARTEEFASASGRTSAS